MPRSSASDNSQTVLNVQWNGLNWVFEDPRRGADQEPFVAGIAAILERAARHIYEPRKGFVFTLARKPFPGCTVELDCLREEYGGCWYRWTAEGLEGWFCPALFRYFSDAPPKLYARADPRS